MLYIYWSSYQSYSNMQTVPTFTNYFCQLTFDFILGAETKRHIKLFKKNLRNLCFHIILELRFFGMSENDHFYLK